MWGSDWPAFLPWPRGTARAAGTDYYREASAVRLLPSVRIPLLFLSARNDPICPAHLVRTDDFAGPRLRRAGFTGQPIISALDDRVRGAASNRRVGRGDAPPRIGQRPRPHELPCGPCQCARCHPAPSARDGGWSRGCTGARCRGARAHVRARLRAWRRCRLCWWLPACMCTRAALRQPLTQRAPARVHARWCVANAGAPRPLLLAITEEGAHSMVWPEGVGARGSWACDVALEFVAAVTSRK